MKKTMFLAISLLILTSVIAQTQPSSGSATYRNLFKISASQFTRNTFQMSFEHYLTPTTSLQFNAGMNYRDNDYEQTWGVGTEAQLKFYVFTQINPRNSHRLYFAPYLMNNYEEVKNYTYNGISGYQEWTDNTFDAIGTGVLFGWSYSFANRINLDIYTGGGIRKAFNAEDRNYSTNSTIFDYGYSGIMPRLGIDVGFWF